MKINLKLAILVSMLLVSGCGDQVWCGENGCGSDSMRNKERTT